jgi:hypothetical protein
LEVPKGKNLWVVIRAQLVREGWRRAVSRVWCCRGEVKSKRGMCPEGNFGVAVSGKALRATRDERQRREGKRANDQGARYFLPPSNL